MKTIVEYTWRIDGVVAGSAQTLAYTFTSPGDYIVELTVTDSEDTTATRSCVLTVLGTTSDATFLWNWDDGKTSTSRIAHKTFQAGYHTVKLTITDFRGQSAVREMTSYIQVPGDSVSYTWITGTGDIVYGGPDKIYSYDHPGLYYASLHIDDYWGRGQTTPSQLITVAENPERSFILDAGVVYLDYGLPTQRMLGATRGGNIFTVAALMRESLAGAKGGRRIDRVACSLIVNMIELSTATLESSLPDSVATISEFDEMVRVAGGVLSGYYDNVAILAQVYGTDQLIICGINNALVDDSMDLDESVDEEASLELRFTGHFSASAPDDEPWFIRFPQE